MTSPGSPADDDDLPVLHGHSVDTVHRLDGPAATLRDENRLAHAWSLEDREAAERRLLLSTERPYEEEAS